MALKPCGALVLVRPDEAVTVSKGGISLVGSAQERVVRGTILDVGPGRYNEVRGERTPVFFRVGDRVVYGDMSGVPVKDGGEELLLMSEHEIIALEV